MTENFHHVMVRGHNRQAIFLDEGDYHQWINILKDITDKYKCKIHLFCLMTNHIHLLVKTEEIPLSRIMQVLLSRYAKWFNQHKEREGYLFQGRYKQKSVHSKKYFLELIYYIHNNPVTATMVQSMGEYPWSSHSFYSKNIDSSF